MRPTTTLLSSLLVLGSAAAALTAVGPAAAVSPVPAPVQNGSYHIDGAHSSVFFEIVHLGVSPFFGRFNSIGGVFVIDEDPANSSVRVEIDADSVDTNSEQRDGHVKNPDFFNATQFPKIVFESDTITKTGDGTYKVLGTLDFHGVKKPVEAEMELLGSGDRGVRLGYRAGFGGSFSLNRLDFNVGEKFPDDMLSNAITLHLGIEGARDK